MTKERVEKRRAEALILQAERQLKEVALDFGMQFERNRRQHIETLLQELRENLAPDDDWGIDQSYANLQDALFELNQQVRVYYTEDEQDDLWDDDPWGDWDDNTGGSTPIPSPRRPGPRPGTNEEAELPPIDHEPPRYDASPSLDFT